MTPHSYYVRNGGPPDGKLSAFRIEEALAADPIKSRFGGRLRDKVWGGGHRVMRQCPGHCCVLRVTNNVFGIGPNRLPTLMNTNFPLLPSFPVTLILAPSAKHNTYRKERAVNGSQRYASTAKVPNLSCKRVPRDSSLTTTKDGCNQAQTGPPTKSPRRMFHRKTAFTEVLFVCAQHLQCIPSPSTDQTNVPLYKGPNKTRMKGSGQQGLNTRMGGL